MCYFVVIGYVAPLSEFDVGFPLLAQCSAFALVMVALPVLCSCVAYDASSASWRVGLTGSCLF